MPGNSQRRGATRKDKKGATAGSGGKGRRGLSGKGPTPRAEDRTGHPAARRKDAPAKVGSRPQQPRRANQASELLVGRNPVLEALRAEVPATALYVAVGMEADERITESIRMAGDRRLPLLEVGRGQLDRMTGGLLHQGMALQVPPYQYAELSDLLARAQAGSEPPLLVVLDGITDPRNLGAVIRSAAGFGAHGLVIAERRAAGVTAAAWRTSAGAAARLPVAQVTNLARTLDELKGAGLFVVGLTADAPTLLDDLQLAADPLVLVVGGEGEGMSRLTRERCDLTVAIPMAGPTESLNASVAAAVALAQVARRRREAHAGIATLPVPPATFPGSHR